MYDYDWLMEEVLKYKLKGYETGIIGFSELKKPIPYIFIGKTKTPSVFVFGAIHAREYITAPTLINLIETYSGDTGIYIAPNVNPDGVNLVINNGKELSKCQYEYVLAVNNNNPDFSLWKANIKAVDLNVNFPADWGTGEQNVRYPAPGNYIGEFPGSAVETRNLMKFTEKINPALTISYHTKGEIIYYGYKDYPDYKSSAQKFSDSTGYPLLTSYGSAGGYKDWFIEQYKRLGMTFEVGNPKFDYPFPLNQLPIIVEQNKDVLNIAGEEAKKLWIQNSWRKQ